MDEPIPNQVPPDVEGVTSPDPEIASRMKTMLAQIWRNNVATIIERIATIRLAQASLRQGILDSEQREQARAAAHKLAGVLGTFGVPLGSALARRVEVLLEIDRSADPQDAVTLAELLQELAALVDAKSQEVG
jgi:HPt (histidine-containing phosphotransfer) domain-containing protein